MQNCSLLRLLFKIASFVLFSVNYFETFILFQGFFSQYFGLNTLLYIHVFNIYTLTKQYGENCYM